MSDDIQPMRSVRNAPGYYTVLGTTHEVEIQRVIYPNDGIYWILTVDGQAHYDPFRTKRDALMAVQADPSL